MIRRPPRSTLSPSSAASDVYKRQTHGSVVAKIFEILMDNNLSFHQISTSEISISLIVNENIATKVAELLAQKFKIGG